MPRFWRALPQRTATTVGDGTTTVFPITHGQGHRDVGVTVRQNGAPYGFVTTGWTAAATDENTVTVTFAAAPTANQYRVIVVG